MDCPIPLHNILFLFIEMNFWNAKPLSLNVHYSKINFTNCEQSDAKRANTIISEAV